MNHAFDITKRQPIWSALSLFYLDTELRERDYMDIAFQIKESPYNMAEVKAINKTEVFPVLYNNLLSPIGEWNYFKEASLAKSIIASLQKRNAYRTLMLSISHFLYKGYLKEDWIRTEKAYKALDIEKDPLTHLNS